MEYISHSEAETEAFGERLAAALSPAPWWPTGAVWAWARPPLPVALPVAWDAGAGSPAPPSLSSTSMRGPTPLFHFDMYRLNGSEDLFDIGWEDYLSRGGVCAVEWSEQVADALPEGTVYVTLTRHPEHDGWRSITVEGGAAR